jgi:hypothetical protein
LTSFKLTIATAAVRKFNVDTGTIIFDDKSVSGYYGWQAYQRARSSLKKMRSVYGPRTYSTTSVAAIFSGFVTQDNLESVNVQKSGTACGAMMVAELLSNTSEPQSDLAVKVHRVK